MLDSNFIQHPIVFLHVPKTAGQTVHNALVRAVGEENVSPVRVHTQVKTSEEQFPRGYQLYSGHLDWDAISTVQNPRFVFSILRDPRERIASFYFYLLREAKTLSESQLALPQNAGKQAVLSRSIDDYFFGGDDAWKAFVDDHYNNFYCRYFGQKRIRPGSGYNRLPARRKLRMALRNLKHIDWIYSVDGLDRLEQDLHALYGFQLDLVGRKDNSSALAAETSRWDMLIDRFESDQARARIEDYVDLDHAFMENLEFE
jgi:hypothetical protein